MHSRGPYSADDIERKRRRREGKFLSSKIHLKIVYWGMAGSGKTTILKRLYDLTKEQKKDIIPVGDLQMITKDNGSTLYFDRGLFNSTEDEKVYYRVYAVAGIKAFTPLRRKVFDKLEGRTDAVIFVVDSQKKFLKDNIESLLELKKIAGNRLIKEFPLVITLNKQDLEGCIDEEEFKHILKKEGLWIDEINNLSFWNPVIYKTCAIREQEMNIYTSFYEAVRRAELYQTGGGDLPYPYIYKPPHPPDDIAPASQPQSKIPKEEVEPQTGLYCQYCGNKIPEGQKYCPICGKEVF